MPKPVHVLCLFPSLSGNGGIQRFNRTLLDVSRAPDITVEAICLTDDDESLKKLSYPDNIVLTGAGGHVSFVCKLLAALWRRRWDVVLVGHINMLRFMTMLVPWTRSRSTHIILVAHGIDVWGRIGWSRRRAVGRCWRVLAVSAYTRDSVLQQAPELSDSRCVIFPNALSSSWLASHHQLSQDESLISLPGKFVLSVTRLASTERYKGIVTVIESMGNWEDTSLHYVVVGHGDDECFLKRIAARCGVAHRVQFLSGLSDVALRMVYGGALAFLLPSGKEGFGIVFLEAMYFRLPVIAARARGALDVVRHGDTGLLVEYGDVIGIAQTVNLMVNDHDLRSHLIRAGRRLVDAGGEFTAEAMAARWKTVLSDY